MTYQVDEREARKAYVRRRQTIVFSISGAVLAVVLVIALLFNFHVFGLGEVETPASQPNYGNAAPCAVKDSSGKAQYVSNASVGIRVMNGTSHGQFAKAVGEALANRGFSVQKIDNYSSTDVERTTIYFGKNAINQAYTLIGNFTDATMIMTAREDQLIDVVIGATALAAEQRGFYLRTRESAYDRHPFVARDYAAFALCIALIMLGVAF